MAIVAPAVRAHARAMIWRRPSTKLIGPAIILVFTVVMTWPLLHNGMIVGQDSAAFFYPVYHFLGQQLAAGHIPGWNPYQFSGVPFIADPESGWMYLPAMFLFAVFPLSIAARLFLFGHLLLAGLGAYAFARTLRMNFAGALVAATAYEFTGILYGRSVCCPAYLQVVAWVPAIFLCMELAIQERDWLIRSFWWGLTGLCLSQVIASWLGQGMYYVLLALGAYIGYRTLLVPPDFAQSWRDRVIAAATHGGAVLFFAFGLAAAGLLPRLDYNSMTNLANGYAGDLSWASTLGGWSAHAMVKNLLGYTLTYAGGAALALAALGIILARRRYEAPFFFFLTAATLVLASKWQSPLHHLLYAVLPRFEELHRHWPERIAIVLYLGLAMLAGAAVSSLGYWRRRPEYVVFVAGIPVLAVLVLQNRGYLIHHNAAYAAALASLLVAAYALIRSRPLRLAIPFLLVLLILFDMRGAGQYLMKHGLYGGFYKVDLSAYYSPQSAGAFLQSVQAGDQNQPFRFFGYDPSIGSVSEHQWALYRYQFIEPKTTELLVNNRATMLGLQDIQGYNPIQLQSYVDYIDAMNGQSQEYHGSYVLSTGLNSRLLDLLNARYIVIPATFPANRADLKHLVESHPTVYQDRNVRVLENQDALPRAWLVHNAQQVNADQSLSLIANGTVDPRQTALLTTAPPKLTQPTNAGADRAAITSYDPDRITLKTTSDAASLLMMSEVYYPDWHAYVDGKPVSLYEADHTLRAVPVPAGTHTIELRFHSRSLTIGLILTGLTALVFLAIVLLLLGRHTAWGADVETRLVRRGRAIFQRPIAKPHPPSPH